MSEQVAVAHAQKYRSDFIMLSQQKGSRLESTVRDDPDELEGKAGFFNRIGAVSMQEILTRHADTLLQDTPHSRRRIILRDFGFADLVDKKDKYRVLGGGVLPSKYATNGMWAAGRKKDDLIIAAANGNAFSIDEDDAASSVALPSAQKILVQSSGLTLAKMLNAKEIHDGAEVDPDEERFAIVTSKQVTNMLNTTEIKNADYNSIKALVEGKVDTFLGYTFKRTERLTVDSSSNRLCLFYLRSGIGLATGQEIEADISIRNDKWNSMQTMITMGMDATRIEDEKVVQIACSES